LDISRTLLSGNLRRIYFYEKDLSAKE